MARNYNLKFCVSMVGSLVIILPVFLVPIARGQALMQLIPPLQEVQVQRGYTGTFSITVVNVGDNDTPAKFTAHDLDITEDGRPVISDGSYERGCGNWIKLEPEECIIKAHETITLNGSISVPRNAEGGYYSLIKGTFVGITIPIEGEKAETEGSAISLENQAMVAVFLTVPSSRNKPVLVPDTMMVFARSEKAAFSEEVSADFKSKRGWGTLMRIRNDGNIHTRVTGNVSFWTEGGKKIDSAPLLAAGRGYLLPDKKRNLTASGEDALTDGYYMMRINLQTSEYFNMSNSFPFAVYEGKVYPGAATEELMELIKLSMPGFSLRQPFLQRNITPGGAAYLVVQLHSMADDTIALIPRKMEWNLDEMGHPTLGNDRSIQQRSCTSWIEFAEDKILLPPGRTASFKIKANSPKNIFGEYYSAIVFDPDKPRADLPAEFMTGRTQLIALVAPGEEGDLLIIDDPIEVRKERSLELTLYHFSFTVRNIGNVHCFAKGSMSLEKEAAKGIYKSVGSTSNFGDTETYLLPGNKRTFEIDIPDLESDTYRAILVVNYKEETQPVVKYQTVKIW